MLNIIFYSVLMFFIVFVFHVFLWRILTPKRHILSLFFMFIFIPIIFIFLSFFIFNWIDFNNCLLILFLYCAIACAYIMTYPAIQAWSPSLFIIYLIGKNNSMTVEEIKNNISENILINHRISDLVKENFIIIEDDESIKLTKKGNLLSSIFIFYRNLFGLQEGQG